MSLTKGKDNFATLPLGIRKWEKIRACMPLFIGRQMSKLTNLNIRKQLKMTHLIGKLPPTTPRYVLEVMSGHGRPPAVFSITSDRDMRHA